MLHFYIGTQPHMGGRRPSSASDFPAWKKKKLKHLPLLVFVFFNSVVYQMDKNTPTPLGRHFFFPNKRFSFALKGDHVAATCLQTILCEGQCVGENTVKQQTAELQLYIPWQHCFIWTPSSPHWLFRSHQGHTFAGFMEPFLRPACQCESKHNIILVPFQNHYPILHPSESLQCQLEQIGTIP